MNAATVILRQTLVRGVIWAAFMALGLAAVVHTGLTQGPAGGAFATAQSIVQRQTVEVDGNVAMIGKPDADASGIAYAGNRYYAADLPGAAFVGVPSAWVGIPLADALKRPDAAALLFGVQTTLLMTLAAAALAWAAVRLGLTPLIGLAAGAIGAGAFLFPVGALTDAALLFVIVALLLALALADGADLRVEEGWTPHGRLALAGLLLGLLPLVVWYGWLACGCVGVVLIAQGGRRWWLRIPWLILGAAGPLTLLFLANAVWFGRPWREAWMYTVGAGWQRSIEGRLFDTPVTALQGAATAFGALLVRHPLLVVGLVGLTIGMYYVPWRARLTTFILAVTLGLPAVMERQSAGLVAESHPVLVVGAFAAAGYIILVALIARERAALLPFAIVASVALVAVGAVVSLITGGADRPIVVPIGTRPDIYITPIALCAGVVVLLTVPGLHVRRPAPQRATAMIGASVLIATLLTSCGTTATVRTAEVTQAPNLLPPLATRLATGTVSPLWTLDANARVLNDGATLTAQNVPGVATSPRVPVQAGDGYRFLAHVVLQPGATDPGKGAIVWLDAMQRTVAESAVPLSVGVIARDLAAPPMAVFAQVVVTITPGAIADTFRFEPRDGGRLDALPNYARAALSFSFDFETAMGGLIHTRGGTTDHDVNDAVARGIAMRDGANFLRRLFAGYDVRATFYVNGYNFLTGNTERRQYVGNPTYARYTATAAGFASDYWTTHPWYGDDPYGTEQSDPAWYFGTLTKQLQQDGHDIESHTFGHLFLHAGITPQQLDDDLTEWDRVAYQHGFPPAHSFAFPWRASNSVTAEYYAVLAKHGITNVTRYYDEKPNTFTLDPVSVYPQLRVVPDQELIDRQGDEMAADRGIDMALTSGGVFSLWAHPESITTAAAQAIWARVVAYAVDRRSLGLWVAPVTAVTDFADARDHLAVSSIQVGSTTRITVRNAGAAPSTGATLTLPRIPRQVGWSGGGGTHDINGAQIRVGDLAPGEATTIEVRFP